MSNPVNDTDFHPVVSLYGDLIKKALTCKAGRIERLRNNIETSEKALEKARHQVEDLPLAIANWKADILILEQMNSEELIREVAKISQEKAAR